MLLSPFLLIGVLVIVAIAMAIVGIFKRDVYNRLSTRIFLLIFASWPLAFLISLVLNEFLYNVELPLRWRLLQQAFILTSGPILLGWLAARLVRRPLRQFNEAMSSLEQSSYRVQLEPTHIREFDEVFTKFNNLIQRLQHEEKLRKDLVSDTSHELKTPLTTMIGQLTAIQEGKYAATEERITILKEQTERLAELVEQLGAYTKARTPTAEKPETIHLQQFCKRLLDHFDLELQQQGITAKLDIADNYTIQANRSALQQIFTNLIQNTLRYSSATELTITATGRTITFSDNGQGVPAESLSYLFERFYRVDQSRNRTTGGLGLGLAIVRELAESQGWAITAEAGHPGLAFILKTKA